MREAATVQRLSSGLKAFGGVDVHFKNYCRTNILFPANLYGTPEGEGEC